MWGYSYCTGAYLAWDGWLAARLAAQRTRFRSLFYAPPAAHELHPNPLTLLMRAVNCIRLHAGRVIQQPCWRAARWKSLT